MIPKRIYLREAEFDDLFTSERMVSCDEPYSDLTVEFTNLSEVWHDASEMPKENYKNIIYQTNYYSMYNVHITFIPTCLRSCKITSRSWNEFVKEVNMKKWAYIDDLLPKVDTK